MKQPSEEDTEALINEVLDAQLQPSATDEAYNERARNTSREVRSPFSPNAPTPEVGKIARRVVLELIGKSGSEKEAIVARAIAPLVAAIDALFGDKNSAHGPLFGCRCDSCSRAIENAAALSDTGEKR